VFVPRDCLVGDGDVFQQHGLVEGEDDAGSGAERVGGGLVGPDGSADAGTDARSDYSPYASAEHGACDCTGSCCNADSGCCSRGGIVGEDRAFAGDFRVVVADKVDDLARELVVCAVGQGDELGLQVDRRCFAKVTSFVQLRDASGENGTRGDHDSAVFHYGFGGGGAEADVRLGLARGDFLAKGHADHRAFGQGIGG